MSQGVTVVPICPKCNCINSKHTTVCKKCSADLEAIITTAVSLTPIQLSEISASVVYGQHPVTLSSTGLIIPVGNKTAVFPIEHKIYVGRDGSPKDLSTFVDLDLIGAVQLGVSRLHALIKKSIDGSYAISDLGSTNGTFINTQEAFPFVFYPLQDQDEVLLGRLGMTVRYTAMQTLEDDQ